jgi:Rad3-related DNA helicase
VSDIKRHKAVGSGIVKADPKGDLVLYVDYARLKAEVERLTEAWVDKKMQEDRDALLEQVERLTEAGDAMALCSNCPTCAKNWQIAKGVQS